MPRERKRRTNRGVPLSVLERASNVIRDEGRSVRAVAKDFNICHTTLYRFHKKREKLAGEGSDKLPHAGYWTTRKVFSEDQERSLRDYLKMAADLYYGLSPEEVRQFAFQLACHYSCSFPPQWSDNSMAGVDWFTGFLKRHPTVSIRRPQDTSLSGTASLNRTNVNKFFNSLGKVLDKHGLKSQNVRNMDETGITMVQTPDRVVARSDENNTFRRVVMESEDVKDAYIRKPPHTSSPADSQVCEDLQMCTTSDEETHSGGCVTTMDQPRAVKKEEPEDEGYLYGDREEPETNVTPPDQSDEEFMRPIKEEEEEEEEEEEPAEDFISGGTASVRRVIIVDEDSEGFQAKCEIKEEEPEDDDYLYCEDCRSFFISECEVHGPALFIRDTLVPVGVVDRARQTLPLGLEILKSSVSHLGLGVFNKGETIPVGVHFGPYQGDVVDRDEAMNSVYSWVIYKSTQPEEYVNAERETHANWLRYVSCARNSEEKNLVAFQYHGGILYRCCRTVRPGQELLVWYEEEYAKHLGVTFNYLWNKKSTNEMKSFPLQFFSCTLCSFSYTSQIYLHKHIKRCHYEEYVRLLRRGAITHPTSTNTTGSQQTSSGNTCTKTGQKQKELCHCSECGKSFPHRSFLLQHQHVHTRERPYHCSECGKSFMRPVNLHIHQRIHTGEKLYHCSHCGKDFTRQNHFLLHQHMHTGEKPYQCSECGKSFTRPGNLQLHKRIHTGEKPYHCVQCGRSFTQQTSFQLHQRIHTGEKPFYCSQCDKSFTRLSTLQRHQLVHTGEKPYQCPECGKSFTQQVNLQLHQRLHTGEKPCHCSQCGKSFTRLSTLQRHQLVHTGEKLYHCAECGKCFTQQVNLRLHRRVHTGEKPFRCSQCEKSFTHLSTLQRHQRTHTGERPYECSQCGKSFSHLSTLQRHHFIHTGEKPYQCTQCGKRFTQLSTLQKHQHVHTKEKSYNSS